MLLSTDNPDLEESARPASLAPLNDLDRSRLSLLFRARADAVSFAALREEDPLDSLAWLSQPHIKPWHEAIRAAHRDHEQTETHLALARALKDITRILDLEADSTLRIRAVNAIIRLANAIHRSRATDHARASDRGASAVGASSAPRAHASPPVVNARKNPQHPSRVREAAELRHAQDKAETAALKLKTHLERLARHDDALQDTQAPLGAAQLPPTERPPVPVRSIPPISPLRPSPRIRPISPTGAISRARPHLNGQLTARAGNSRPPPDRQRKRGHSR